MTITASKMEIVSEHRNLEQIRAKNALLASAKIGTGSDGGRAVAKKVPAQIVQNGFLAALAFAIESVNDDKFVRQADFYYQNTKPKMDKEGKKDPFQGCGYANTFVSVMEDLKETGRDCGVCGGDLKGFLNGLCKKSADELRTVTDEAICYLNYLRRFAGATEEE